MFKIKYLIETLSPIIISDDSADENLIPTKEYITGSALRGLFADIYLRNRSLQKPAYIDEEFKRLFLDDGVVFTNAYLSVKIKNEILTSEVLPFFIQNIKNTDRYVNIFYQVLDEPTKLKKMFYIAKNNQFKIVETKKRIFFHNAINYKTGTTREGFIFNYESIEPQQIFCGEIIGEEKDLNQLLNLINKKELTARIGKSKNTQYGNIKITLLSEKPEFFNPHIPLEVDKLVLVCQSDLVLMNKYGYNFMNLNDLEQYLSDITEIKDLKIEKAIFRTLEIEGFISVWKARRQKYIAIEKGSSFLLSNIDREKILKLKELCKSGIGLLKGEGYGRITFLNPEKTKIERFAKDSEHFVEKPKVITDKNREILMAIYIENQKRWLKTMAIEDATKFKLIPSPSLLSRIEVMINKSNSMESFIKKVSTLRKKAKNDLEMCNNGNITLFGMINNEIKISAIVRIKEELQKFLDEINQKDFLRDDGFAFYKIYLITLLYSLRKLKKEKK